MLTLFGRPVWYDPPKLLSLSLDGEDTSQQIFDIYSLSHVTHGILFYFILRAFRVRPATGLYLSILGSLLFEIFENTDFIIQKYRKTYANYKGDSVMNIVGDLLCVVVGYLFSQTYPVASVLFVLLTEIILYPYKASLLQLSVCRLVPLCYSRTSSSS
jgi:hypothetical protein